MTHKSFLLLALCLLPATAVAQSSTNQTIEDVRRDARVHIGPFYLSPTLQLKELGVDTNVFNMEGESNSDFMFNLSPGVKLWVPFSRRGLLTTTAATDAVWYAKYTSERSLDPQITVRADVFLHRLTLFGENAYLNTRQRPNFEIDLRSRHLDNTAVAGAAYQLTPKLSFAVSAGRSIVRYDANAFFLTSSLRETLNRNTTTYNLTVRQRLSPLTTVVLLAERSADRFPFVSLRDTKSFRFAPGVELKPKALIGGNASVGLRTFQPATSGALPGYTGLVANVALSYTLLGATTFGVSGKRDVQYSFEPLQPYYLVTSSGASARRALGRRFDVVASADRHRYAYRDLKNANAPSSLPARSRVDTTWNYAGSLGYRMTRVTRVGFGVSFWQRRSTTVNFREYSGVRIGTTVTYGF